MLNFDPAFFLYKMIEYKDFSIELNRWGSAPSQLLPLWAIKNGFSLEWILKIYSASFILLYYIFFLITTLVLKNNKAGIAMMLALCIGFRHAFYYSTAELFQGMALSFLVWALISPEKIYNTSLKKCLAIFFSVALILIISFYHQLALFVILFILLIEFFDKGTIKNTVVTSVLIIAVLWFAVRVFFLSNTSYEAQKILDANTFFAQFPNLFNLPSTIYLKQFVKDNFMSFSITIFSSIALFVFRKKWFLLLLSLMYFIGFLILILVTYYQGESPVMMEDYFTVLGSFVAVVLVFLLYEKINSKPAVILICILLIIHLKGIYDGHYTMTKRINYLDRIISYGRTFEKRKFLIHSLNFPWQYAWVKWAVPFETALLSSISSPDSVVTAYIVDNMNQYDSLINKENIFLGPPWAITWFWSSSADKQYFNLPSLGYEKLNSEQNDSTFDESVFNKNNVKIIPEKEIYYSDADSFVVIPVTILNKSGKTLSSITDGNKDVHLSYHIYDNNDNLILWDGVRTPLEVDVISNYKQGLFVNLPKQNGEYIIEADFVTENKRWWGINCRFNLIVN